MRRFIGTVVSSRVTGIAAQSASLRAMLLAVMAVVALAVTGCSISNSISDSISSPFKWSSRSSDSGDQKESYQRDVRDYTEAYLRSSSDPTGFRNGLASLATKHGISNWEADEATYAGIGEGLGKAKVKQSQVEVFKTNLAGSDPVKAAALQNGYDRYKND
jgi:hypothetical protein